MTHLRAVGPEDRPATAEDTPPVKPAAPMTAAEAALNGSPRDLLETLLRVVCEQIDFGVPPRDLASLSKRAMELRDELAKLATAEDGDTIADAADEADTPWPG